MKTRFSKRCSACNTELSLTDILENPEVEPIGMLIQNGDPDVCLYYFNHRRADCGTTFTIPVQDFTHLITEPIPAENLCMGKQCEGRCTTMTDLRQCGKPCRNAPYRRFLLSILDQKRLSTLV